MTPAALNLCLHYASADDAPAHLTVSRGALRALVAKLRGEGRQPASLEGYALGSPPDGFTLSFDDAHASVLVHALPVLHELGVTATLFVPTGYVGTSDAFLDWDGVRALRDAGWTIGSHSESHGRMSWRFRGEDAAAHEARLVAELSRSRAILERELGAAPLLFAYPYGEAPAIARRAARRAGFAAAVTVAGDAPWDGDPFSVPRLDADAILRPSPVGDGPLGISVIVPAYDRVRILADVVTRLASQTYPKDRYEVIVVDDGSREELAPVVADMPENVRLVRQGDATFRAGQARQRGVDEAQFDHVAFLDADVAVGPDFLWHHDWAHRHAPDAVVLGYLSGYNLNDDGGIHAPDDVVGKDLASLPIIPDRSREPALRSCLDNVAWLDEPWQLTYTGNLSVPKPLLARAGGFASAFAGWGLEDIDLGFRLHRAGGRFVFSRFALGHHVVDPSEGPGRNPFRARAPTRDAFRGYEENLVVLDELHPGEAAITRFVARSRSDIEETCGRPTTVGIEMGGAARVRTRHHRRIHHVQPGGIPTDELLDRVVYAKKVSAKTIYLLGGSPEEHPAFRELVRAAKAAVSWVSMQSLVYPFGEDDALDPRALGIDGVVAVVYALDARTYERLHGPHTFEAFERGLARLDGRVELSAHLVVCEENVGVLDATLTGLAERAIRLEELSVVGDDLVAMAESATGLSSRTC